MAKGKPTPAPSLFDFEEPEIAPVVTAHIPGSDTMAPETLEALCTVAKVVWSAADRIAVAYCAFCGEKPPHGVKLPAGWCWDTDEPDNSACYCPKCLPSEEPTPVAVSSCTQPGFWANKLAEMGEMRLLAARSFIEVARRSGIEHEAVKPTGTDSNGQKTYDMGEVTRLANLMRGKPESLKPELKTEAEWQAAIEGVKAWKIEQQGGAL